MVVLEPSCAASLRTDLTELLPSDPRAASLAKRVVTLAEILDKVGFQLPDVSLRDATGATAATTTAAVMQPHCHQQAVLGTTADAARHGTQRHHRRDHAHRLLRPGRQLRSRARPRTDVPGGGGAVAGARADAADADALILADGFSCRTQIESLSGRRAVHLAEVLAARLPAAPGEAGTPAR